MQSVFYTGHHCAIICFKLLLILLNPSKRLCFCLCVCLTQQVVKEFRWNSWRGEQLCSHMSDVFHREMLLTMCSRQQWVEWPEELQVAAGGESQDDLTTPGSDRLHRNVACELPSYGLQLEIGLNGGRYGSILTFYFILASFSLFQFDLMTKSLRLWPRQICETFNSTAVIIFSVIFRGLNY